MRKLRGTTMRLILLLFLVCCSLSSPAMGENGATYTSAAQPTQDVIFLAGQAAYGRHDCETAFSLWQPLADQGYARAEFDVGTLYFSGCGVTLNYVEARNYFQRAAEHGDAYAQHDLGTMYLSGLGGSQDYGEATKWFRQAAEQGLKEDQYNVGLSCEQGWLGPPDFTEAMSWYRKSAEQGFASAQWHISRMYETGEGVKQSFSEAYFWMILAATSSGDEDVAASRDSLTNLLSSNQVSEIRSRASKWKPAPAADLGGKEDLWPPKF